LQSMCPFVSSAAARKTEQPELRGKPTSATS